MTNAADVDILIIDPSPRRTMLGAILWWATHNKVMALCLAFVILVSTMAIFPGLLTRFDPFEIQVGGGTLRSPSSTLWMGTDRLGRDQFSRLVYGARPSLAISAASTIIVVIVGVFFGVLAGYWKGWIERIIMRLSDTVMAFPPLILALAFVTALGPSASTIVITLAFSSWPRFARLARASTLQTRETDYVTAARAIGAGNLRISVRHILPNIASPIIVQAALMLSIALLAEAALSFLGLGIAPPAPSWGRMVAEGQPLLREAPWIAIAPGTMIFLVVLALNLLGDHLRDVLDPRLRGR